MVWQVSCNSDSGISCGSTSLSTDYSAGPLPSMWETQVELQAPVFCLTQPWLCVAIWRVKPMEDLALFLSLSLISLLLLSFK